MTDPQFSQLINVLSAIAEKQTSYTLTGASDWPLLTFIGAGIVALMIYIWRDLKATMKENKDLSKLNLDEEVAERKAQDAFIWKAMRACQHDCCPRVKAHNEPN